MCASSGAVEQDACLSLWVSIEERFEGDGKIEMLNVCVCGVMN